MYVRIWSKKLIPFLLAVVFFICAAGASTARAQRTSLEIEEVEVKKGDTVTVAVTLSRALEGLGRLDATIVSGSPDVFALTSLMPSAVSEEFMQIDLQEKDRIKFKLVDLRKSVDPGDDNVELLKFTGEATNTGASKLSLEDIKYTDEEGNVLEPTVKDAEVTIEPAETSEVESHREKEEEPTDEEKEEPEREEGQAEEETKGKKVTGTEPEPEEKAEVESDAYSPILDKLSLKLGEAGTSRFKLVSLPDGLRMAEVWIANAGGLDFSEVSSLALDHFEVVKKTEELINFRFVDFEGTIKPETDELRVAEIVIDAISPGETEIRVKRLEVWTDSGAKIVRQGYSVSIEVVLGPIGRSSSPPRDLDDDGLYEDINGDGELTETDAFILAFNIESKFIRENTSLFDFDWDGRVSFSDAAKLMQQIE